MKIGDLSLLVIDDVEMVQKSLVKCLNKLGITKITTTDSIDESWEIINNQQIDIILSDWNMPKGDGIELLEKLRSSTDPKLSLQKFIMVTGSNDKVIVAMDNGAHNVIHKPFDSETIKKKIDLLYGQIF